MTTSDRTRNRWKSNQRSNLKSFCRSDATVATQYIDCSQSNVAAGVHQSPGNKMDYDDSYCNSIFHGNALCKSEVNESLNADHLDNDVRDEMSNLIKLLLDENLKLKQEVKSLKASAFGNRKISAKSAHNIWWWFG